MLVRFVPLAIRLALRTWSLLRRSGQPYCLKGVSELHRRACGPLELGGLSALANDANGTRKRCAVGLDGQLDCL